MTIRLLSDAQPHGTQTAFDTSLLQVKTAVGSEFCVELVAGIDGDMAKGARLSSQVIELSQSGKRTAREVAFREGLARLGPDKDKRASRLSRSRQDELTGKTGQGGSWIKQMLEWTGRS